MNTNKTVKLLCVHSGYIVDAYFVTVSGEGQRGYFPVRDYKSTDEALNAARNLVDQLYDEISGDLEPTLGEVIWNALSIHNQQAMSAA